MALPFIATTQSSANRQQSHNPTPTELKLIRYENTALMCSCVSWMDDGNILCSSFTDRLEVRSGQDLSLIKQIKIKNGKVWSALIEGGKLITKVCEDDSDYLTFCVYIGTDKNPRLSQLHEYKSNFMTPLSVSNSKVADIDHLAYRLMVYTIAGNHLYNINLSGIDYPTDVHILADDDGVLVSDNSDGKLRKYKLQAGEHESQWICEGLYMGIRITADQSGYIYVNGGDANIYQVSSEGWCLIVLMMTRQCSFSFPFMIKAYYNHLEIEMMRGIVSPF